MSIIGHPLIFLSVYYWTPPDKIILSVGYILESLTLGIICHGVSNNRHLDKSGVSNNRHLEKQGGYRVFWDTLYINVYCCELLSWAPRPRYFSCLCCSMQDPALHAPSLPSHPATLTRTTINQYFRLFRAILFRIIKANKSWICQPVSHICYKRC